MEAVQKAEELQPDLILLDIGLPKLSGIEAAKRIRNLAPHTRIVFLSQEFSSDVVYEALRSGAMGYVLKSAAGRDLLPAIQAVLGGRRFVSRSLDIYESRPETVASVKPAPARYEIFQKFADQQPVWVGTAENIDDAQRRIDELARTSHADYFVFDTVNVCFVFQHDDV